MIIFHLEYDRLTGEIDIDECYVDVDTSFVEAEDSQIRELVRREPHD